MRRPLPLCCALLLTGWLGGCNTVSRGTTQVITVEREPADAACTVQHPPDAARVPITGATATVERTRFPLVIECSKPGYVTERRVRAPMNTQGAGLGLLPVGALVDMASGSNNSYPPLTRMRLEREKAE